ncbi:MucR family transcriptional regulator [Litorimonas taeanensis]|uniref:MucR family transcriptional regulator n=1 Tax=Litorimonas taeanensis TaxID=568099 RepID=A0A420WIZ7_9PROT|nr:MucR family transcriptional regulator [Litorimonas taeanensis]RKQ70895.1 MucR family transcriptional regulator [Litorimonas taeanensis]
MSDNTPIPSKESEALLAHVTQIASAYLSRNKVPAESIPELLTTIYDGLVLAVSDRKDTADENELVPAVPIEDSLSDDAIICLEDGLSFQSLKRHLRVKYDMTPEAYRKKWGLPLDYPMVAPNYAKRRSELAKRTGLGKHRTD